MKKILIFTLLLIFSSCGKQQQETAAVLEKKDKICLNMIVKNESRVIKRCLDSVIPLIDSWVIVDTGSKDNTQNIIRKHLKGIPGKLYERPWKNFGENRSEALKLAKQFIKNEGYILFMDADDVLEYTGELPTLTKDLYNMWRGPEGFSYIKPQIARADLPWKWVGVTHEYLGCDQYYTSETLKNVKYVTISDGASSVDPNKFIKNVKLLKKGLVDEPKNERYMFYLAESYRDLGKKGKALECYQKRILMGGWNEEIFWSMLQIAHHMKDIGLPDDTVINSYLKAHQFRRHRKEPLYFIAEMYNKQKEYSKAYECIKASAFIPQPAEKDVLFNQDWIEEYGLLFQLSICSYYLGHYQESLDACDKLLAMKNLPEYFHKLAVTNRAYPLEKLSK